MTEIAIIGAGLAGLNCALTLEGAGVDVTLIEAADAPGGRIRTDIVEGFRLDRGFQVMLTRYPEAERAFDYEALKLRPLRPGALVRHDEKFHRFADPFREPLAAMRFALDNVIPLQDKLRVAKLRSYVMAGETADIFAHPENTTMKFLQEFGFSAAILERFFIPFFGGVFLERELGTSSRFFEFLFRMFASGQTAVPENGMEELPRQLAAQLKAGTLLTHAKVRRITRSNRQFAIETDTKGIIEAAILVLAVAEHDCIPLLSGLAAKSKFLPKPRKWNQTTTFYYAAESSPVDEPIIVLNGEGAQAGPINNLAVMSRVSSQYAPPGAELIAASVVEQAPETDEGMALLEREVRDHAARWFGRTVNNWRVIGGYPIQYALPFAKATQWQSGPVRPVEDGIYLCGDAQETPSINGALKSGRRVAEALLVRTGARAPRNRADFDASTSL